VQQFYSFKQNSSNKNVPIEHSASRWRHNTVHYSRPDL